MIVKQNLKKIKVSKRHKSLRLDQFLSQTELLPTRSQALKLISKKQVFINEKVEKASTLLKEGDIVKIILSPTQKTSLIPYDFPLDILFEDKNILVVNKPAGLVVHPSYGHEDKSLVNALLFKTKLSPGSSPLRPGVVHRLDKDVSGLLVLAKTKLAEEQLIKQFKSRKVQREYWALSLRPPSPLKGTIETFIKRHPIHRKKFISLKNFQSGGKKAISSYNLFKQHKSGLSWIKVQLQTGRTHQIRLHLSSLSCPLVGDQIYGRKKLSSLKDSHLKSQVKNLNRIALHAHNLAFLHPTSSKPLSFQCPWPTDLKELLKRLDFI